MLYNNNIYYCIMEAKLKDKITELERCNTGDLELGTFNGNSPKLDGGIMSSMRATQRTTKKTADNTSRNAQFTEFYVQDLLDGTYSNIDMMDMFDDCLQVILNEFDYKSILDIDIKKCEEILLNKERNKYLKLKKYANDSTDTVVAKLLHIARQCKSINLATNNEDMVYVPQNIFEFQDLIDSLSGGVGFKALQTLAHEDLDDVKNEDNNDNNDDMKIPDDADEVALVEMSPNDDAKNDLTTVDELSVLYY